jgi:hypothetical protein
MSETEPILAKKIAGATRVDTSLADKQIAGSTNKKLSTESRALEPAMWNGSDGLGGTSGHRCVVWIAHQKTYALLINSLIEQGQVD